MFKCKVKFAIEKPQGEIEKVSEVLLISAMTFTECEGVLLEYLTRESYSMDFAEITSISRYKLNGIVSNNIGKVSDDILKYNKFIPVNGCSLFEVKVKEFFDHDTIADKKKSVSSTFIISTKKAKGVDEILRSNDSVSSDYEITSVKLSGISACYKQ